MLFSDVEFAVIRYAKLRRIAYFVLRKILTTQYEPRNTNPTLTNFITQLDSLIADRKANPTAESYTNKLLANPHEAAQKVGEEATEVVIAALAQSKERLIEETADLVYHSLVLLHTRDLSWQDIIRELENRHGG